MVEWVFDSLHRECSGSYGGMNVAVVDFFGDEVRSLKRNGDTYRTQIHSNGVVKRVSPKPNVWNGPHRLTKQDWFAAANQRNTALCLAPDGWIAYVDDLSVLLPGWLSRVRKAMAENYIVCGSYKKVKELVVENGEVKSFKEYPAGVDNRLKHVNDVVPCGGNWMYGCSLAAPVDALLDINGFGEICDGLGFEDCCTGIVMKNAGYEMRYDPQMMTYESEELHHVEPPFRKEDWHFEDGKPVVGGNGGTDKSHSALNIARQSTRFEYDVGGGFKDLRELRAHVLAGGEFPIRKTPEHCWYTKIPLKDL